MIKRTYFTTAYNALMMSR